MKVKYYVCRYETYETEINDKFIKLDVARPWEDKSITEEDYEDCVKEIEEVTGIPFGTDGDEYICAVWSVKTGENILET